MGDFVYEIGKFIWNLIYSSYSAISAYYSRGFSNNATQIGLSYSTYEAFLDKPLISGDLINITMTFRELLLYVVPILLVALAIYLFVKFAFKLLSLFSLR